MKINQILATGSIRIILHLYEKGEVRHSELSGLMTSRGTLRISLNDLAEEGLIQRRVVDTKPIQSFYSLTEKGSLIAKEFQQIQKLLNKENK